MKKIIFLLISLISFIGNAQINVNEGFESSLPADWTLVGFSSTPSTLAFCGGSSSLRASLGGSNAIGSVTTSSYVSDGNAINVSFKHRISSGSQFVNLFLYYQIGTGAWVTAASSNSTTGTCQQLAATIPSGTVANGTVVKFKMEIQTAAYIFVYFDDFSAIQSSAASAPSISTVSSTAITSTSATINYSLNANNAATTSIIRYGTTSSNLTSQTTGATASGNTLTALSTQLSGLTPNTLYYYQIEATNSAGTTSTPINAQNTFTTTTPPAGIQFSNLTASQITNTTAAVSVTLANVCEGSTYRLQRATNAAFTTGVVDTQFSTNGTNGIKTHYLSGLVANTNYYFRFYTAPNQGCGNAIQITSDTASFTTTSGTPGIQFFNLTSSSITDTGAIVSVTLANLCSGQQFYHLQYSTSATFASNVTDTVITSYNTNGISNSVISGLSPNTVYYFRFYSLASEACNPSQVTSDTASFTTTNGSSPIQFSALNATAITNTSATLGVTLANVCPNAVYRLQYSLTLNFNSSNTTILYNTNVTNGVKTQDITGLLPNTNYYYRYYSLANEACNTVAVYSPTLSFTTLAGDASIQFSNLTSSAITNSTATLSVTLANVCPGANYRLQYSTSATFPVGSIDLLQSTNVVNGVNNINITGLTPNTTYYYRFYANAGQACNPAQVLSATASFTTTNGTSPIEFSNLAASAITNTTATVSVTVGNVCAGAQYTMQVATSAIFPAGSTINTAHSAGDTNGVKTHNLTGLLPNTTYYFRFYSTPNQACNATSVFSATANFTTTNNTTVTPTFTQVPPICSGATLAALPTTSTNGITGTWSPALNNTTTTTYTFMPASGQFATSATMTITVNPNVTPTFPAVAPICAGATLAALPTTSTNGITGTWSPTLNNTATTTYTFTPTAGQCATSVTRTITVNPNVIPTFPAVAPICSGATLAALPTTSTNGITGTWSPALNNTATTTYTFTPTAGQCATSVTKTITVNPNVTPTFPAVAPICAGTTLAALPTTSTNGITGTWSPALNNTTTTTYTFMPASGQCATSVTKTITVNPSVTPTFPTVAPICSGTTLAALPTTSTNGITGTWSPALNNTTTTTYTFTPTAGQCATSVTKTITVNPSVTPTFPTVAPICSRATLAALPTTSTNGITGTWSPALNNTTTTTYTFMPASGQCATSVTKTITVNPSVTPTFPTVAPICSGATLAALPTTSTNGITGTWSPALNNTATTTYTFTPTAGQCATSVTRTITVNPNVTPTFPTVAPICSGATLAALPTTSTNGITGTWSPALNNTATTTYTFMPASGQCAASVTKTITVNPNVTPTFPAIAPICAGATLAALPTTSTNGITGTWSPALNNTATTTYTFTPTAGQCATSVTRTITVNPNVTPTFPAVAPICSGATLAALPTTSTNGIIGTWSPALNNTATTTYTFTPTAGQCATSVTRTITVNPNVTPTFPTVAPICSGATLAALPTTSTNGITGTWSPALNNTTTTTYTFMPASGQCATSATKTIVVNSAATPTGAATQTFVEGATIANLVASPTNVIWYASNANAISGSNPLPSTTLLVNLTTYYAVNVVGSCRSNPLAVTVSITLGTDTYSKINLMLYPNPVLDILNIQTDVEIKSVIIYNIQGQRVMRSTQKQVDVTTLPSGMYLVEIHDSENNAIIKKFMKK